MDSFRPGSSSYCPFPNEDEIINNSDIEGDVNEPTNDDLQNNNVSFVNLHSVTNDASSTSDNDDTDNENLETTEDVSNDESRESSEEENRRRLYLNTGRPRPFYRVHSSSPPQSLLETAPVTSTRTSNQCKQKEGLVLKNRYFVTLLGNTFIWNVGKTQHLLRWELRHNSFFKTKYFRKEPRGHFRKSSGTISCLNTGWSIYPELSRGDNYVHSFRQALNTIS